MESVVTYQTKKPTPQLPAIQVSTLPSKMRTGQDLQKKVVEEFIGCWGVQREASLSFIIEHGKVTLTFSAILQLQDLKLLRHQLLDLLLLDLQFPNLYLLDLQLLDLRLMDLWLPDLQLLEVQLLTSSS